MTTDRPMQLGMVGLGRMGSNLVRRLMRDGHTYYRDDVARHAALAERGIGYVDCGTSGGVFGLDRGFCLMLGGDERDVRRLEPIFASLAPGVDVAPRTPGRSGEPAMAEHGYLHCGPPGAGHF